MGTTRLALIVLMSGVGAACAAATHSTPDPLRTTAEERREMRDSAAAQAVADQVGPRVTVRADFDYAAGARHVEASFHMYDDAYVIVGHLDGAGRLRVVFPSSPGDDGFVRGDKIYHVPSFFAGFNDEYAWRYSTYRYSRHNYEARRDSYDAGMGYVFVVASWRPMRLDRITDGSRWESYEVSDVSYMSDPREAVEELASVIAGDNREAYTIEYARYSTTNSGMYAFSDFDAVNSGCFGYGSLGFGRLGLAFGPYGFLSSGFGLGSGNCPSAFGYASYPYGYGYGYGYPGGYSPPIAFAPPIRRGPITTPFGLPALHLPRIEAGAGGLALHQPGAAAPAAIGGTSQYRRPGLVAEDVGGRRAPGERHATGNNLGFTSQRPTIQQMIGARRLGEENRGASGGISRDNPSWPTNRAFGGSRGDESRGRSGETGASARESGRSYGGSAPRATERGEGRGEATRAEPSHVHGGESARSSPPPRSEPAAHAAPSHSEPSARSAPPASSGSSGSKKP